MIKSYEIMFANVSRLKSMLPKWDSVPLGVVKVMMDEAERP